MQTEEQLEGKKASNVAATVAVGGVFESVVQPEDPPLPAGAECPVAAPGGWIVLALLLLVGMCLAWGAPRVESRGQQPTQFVEPPVFEMDINNASAAQLQALPEIGEMLARRVVDYREANGPFRSADDLILVRGFGPTTMQRLESMVSVKPDTSVE